jgi:hypothetical protein
MFVRWKRRERTTKYRKHTDDWVRYAVLVRSERTPGGPRLKHVCYLGSIGEGLEGSDHHRDPFWRAVERKLDALGVKGTERKRIEAALLSVVPKPGKAYRAQQRRTAKIMMAGEEQAKQRLRAMLAAGDRTLRTYGLLDEDESG